MVPFFYLIASTLFSCSQYIYKTPYNQKFNKRTMKNHRNQRTNITHDSLLYGVFDDNEKAVADILLQLPRLILDQNLTSRFLPWGSKKRRSDVNVNPSSSSSPLQSIPEEQHTVIKAEPPVPEPNIPCSSQPKRPTNIKLVLPKPKLPPCLAHTENLNTLQIKLEPPNPETDGGVLGVKPLKPKKKASQEKTKENLDNKDNLLEGKRPITIKTESPSPKAAPSRFTSAALDTKPLKPKRIHKKTKEELENKVAELTECTNDLVMEIGKVKKHFEKLKAINLKLKAYKQQQGLPQNKAKSDLGGDTNIGPEVKEHIVQTPGHQQIPITPHQSPFVMNQMAYGPETFGKWPFPYGQTPPLLGFNNDMSMREGLRPFGDIDTNISLFSQRTLGMSFIDQIKETKLTKQ